LGPKKKKPEGTAPVRRRFRGGWGGLGKGTSKIRETIGKLGKRGERKIIHSIVFDIKK